jgi:twinkle protein
MAAVIRESDIDFAAYERMTDARVKVRPASVFSEEIAAQFRLVGKPLDNTMRSTKLRGLLEFRPGEVTCWAGYNGHRKSMFSGQVAFDLCMQDKRVLLASFEMQPARTLARMARQCSGNAVPVARELAAFSGWTDGRLWVFDHVGRINPSQVLAVCRYFADELKGQHVFIDSMMMVCASEESLDEQKQFMTDLVRVAQETGLHLHLIAHCRKPQAGEDRPPTKYDLRGSAAISDQAHNVVTVWANKAKKAALDKNPFDDNAKDEPDAAITVEKQRNGEFEGRLKMWFDMGSLRFLDDRMAALEPWL